MGLLDRFKKSSNLDADAQIALTEEGKRAVDRMMVQGKGYTIVASLDEHSPRSMSNLCRENRMDIHATQHEVNKLRRQGLVRIIDSE